MSKGIRNQKSIVCRQGQSFFGPKKPNRTNVLEIGLEVSLEMSFQAVDEHFEMITAGTVIPGPVAKEYKFNPNIFNVNAGTLQGVEIIGIK